MKIFLMKSESFLTLLRQQCKYHIFTTVILWSYEYTFCVQQNKHNDFIQQLIFFRVSLHKITVEPLMSHGLF